MAIKTHTESRWIVPLVVMLCYFIIKGTTAPIGDFGNYYYASHLLLTGNWGTWIYDPATFNLAVYKAGQRDSFLNYAPVPPLSAIIYLPLSVFDSATAKVFWNSVNGLLLLLALHRLQRHFNVTHWLLWFTPILFFTPIRNTIYEGQSYFLLLFLLSEGLIRYTKQQTWKAAFLWAFCIHLKISPAFILLFLAFEKNWKSLLSLLAASALLLFISLPALGTETWSNYILHILPRLFNGEINNTYAINYQGMQVLLKRLFVPDLMHNPNAAYNNPDAYYKLTWLFHLLIYALAVSCSFTKIKPGAKFSIWLMCSLLVSGYGNSFSLILLVLPLFGLHEYLLKDNSRIMGAALLLLLLSNIPVAQLIKLPVVLQFPRLYILLAAFLFCTWWIRPNIKPLFFILVLPALLLPVDPGKYTQNYFLPKEEHLLTYDFKLQHDSLVMNVFDASGPKQKSILLPFSLRSVKDLTPAYRGMVAPKLVNDSIVLYLSDQNRGVGFYTLRHTLLDALPGLYKQ